MDDLAQQLATEIETRSFATGMRPEHLRTFASEGVHVWFDCGQRLRLNIQIQSGKLS